MRTGLLGHAPVAVAVLVEVARGVAGVVVVLTGNFLPSLVAVAVLVEVAGLVARVVMVLTGLFLRHG
ncbi:hypothetical protein [Roseicella aerolata]|uniref:Uncharacterized protein n=1 Tax=Roseicella aerolata TaxID=2883479 RepID=A0A9X1LA93_9PROT|nr:hypothetical protein [Roseicella aerolata]MCB4824559.1 hypothetical protein [Roseicella aerolata]